LSFSSWSHKKAGLPNITIGSPASFCFTITYPRRPVALRPTLAVWFAFSEYLVSPGDFPTGKEYCGMVSHL